MNRLLKLILYQKPKHTPFLFKPGLEDRWGTTSESNRSGARQGDFAETGATGAASYQGRYIRSRATRENKKSTPVQQKFAGKIKENQSIEKLLADKTELAPDLEQNRRVLARIFRVPRNQDVVLRSLTIGTRVPVQALLVFLDGATDTQLQNLTILQPLMLLPDLPVQAGDGRGTGIGGGETPVYNDLLDRVHQALVPANQVIVATDYTRVVEDVLSGNSALFIDGCSRALLLETRGWQYRSISTPQVENVIRGPQEAFTEQIRANTSLVRRAVQLPSLVTEFIKVGDAGTGQFAIMYLDDVANPNLVGEVKRRMESIRADYVQKSGLLEQLIEDSPFSFAPQILATERPDRVTAGLMEGRVAILVNGSPFVLVVPATFFSMMQSPEDAYVRWPFDSFGRLIRYAGLLLALLLPANYIAIVAFHQEFIPTDLLLAMNGAREKVPFPSIVEVLIMELSFELIREAGVRIPGTVGTTLGIVGALILGQAAVAANIVSPILIIVVAVTALGSFTIPNYGFSTAVRVMRFIYILLAAVAGLLGILVGFFIHLGLMANLKSFGVPFMTPAAPVVRKNKDYFMRGREWEQENRPDALDPLQKRRQPRVSRGWTGHPDKGDQGTS